MSEAPPQYAAYPRGLSAYGSVERLRALVDGYYGLNLPFVICALVLIVCQIFVVSTGHALYYVIAPLLAAVLTYPPNKKIVFGKDWSPSVAIVASVLTTVMYFVCFGIIGFVVMQMIAGNEIKKYGAQSGAFGIKKKEMLRVIAERTAADSASPAALDVPPVY